ncbi:MAG TPA: gliding motility lipoprotein GldH [Bacteroidales bacterium]|nr:gliding motility lipoprotein GldH [Bacteroidales bacterium]
MFFRIKSALLSGTAIMALILMSACDRPLVFEQFTRLPSDGWHYEDKVIFETLIDDTTSLHNLHINIRNTTDYAYSNFFLFLDIKFPDGKMLRDTIECVLADQMGQWTGRGFGRIRSNRFLFRTDVWFPQPGTYTFSLQHAMRTEILGGISDIGLRIETK